MSFLFERDFDAEMEDEARKPAAPTTAGGPDAAEIERMLAEAHAAGLAEGEARGMQAGEQNMLAQIEASLAASLEDLLPQIAALRAELAERHGARERDLIQMVRFLAGRVLPEVEERHGARRIAAFCRRAMTMAEGEEGLRIALSPEVLPLLAVHLEAAAAARRAPLELVADPALPRGTARASWRGGGAETAAEVLAQDILTTLDDISRAIDAPTSHSASPGA